MPDPNPNAQRNMFNKPKSSNPHIITKNKISLPIFTKTKEWTQISIKINNIL
jgi:hypothetical protein